MGQTGKVIDPPFLPPYLPPYALTGVLLPHAADNATPVRLLPPSIMGRVSTLFSLPGTFYAQPGILVPNARALKDGTGAEAKPRAVFTVPIPEGVLRGRAPVLALGAVRAVAAASVELLGDGLTNCFYDLWMAENARSPRLLDAAFASLGLCLPVMVGPP